MTARELAAYRARMGIVAALQSCACMYPLEKYASSTEHHELCPAHRVLLLSSGPHRLVPDLADLVTDARPFGMRPSPSGGFIGCCTVCKGEFTAESYVGLCRAMVAEHNHGAAAAEAKLRAEMAAVQAELASGRAP